MTATVPDVLGHVIGLAAVARRYMPSDVARRADETAWRAAYRGGVQPRPPLWHRLRHRLRPGQKLALDAAAALGYALVTWGVFTHKVYPWSLGLTGTFLAALAVALCRRWPLLGAGAALACFWLSPRAVVLAFLAVPPMACALYQTASRVRPRAALLMLAASLTGPVATALPGFTRTGGIAPFAAVCLIAFAAGYTRQANRRYGQELLDHHASQAEAERERARRGAAEERMRIARELHDVMAHSMSLITVQAGFGHLVIDQQPDDARAALATIELAGRETLAEMRRLLGVLRDDDVPALTPAPGIADLGQLAAQVRQAGVAVELIVTGGTDDLPAGVGMSAYRIVQEALTNVVKHAGPCAARALITCRPEELIIEVTDNGRGGAVTPGGLGLAGMTERVHVYGGHLKAAPLPGGGFQVVARLPLPATADVRT